MKKIGDQIQFFKDNITQYNCITEIISADDRSDDTIADMKKEIHKAASAGGINIVSAETLQRILTYYQELNEGIKLAFSIMFKNGHIWNIEYTSSGRSDRIEGFSARLSRNPSDKNYIIIGDYGTEFKLRKRLLVDPRNNLQVVSMEEFVDDLLYEIYSYQKNGKSKIPISKSPLSQINGNRGPFWEECIAECIKKQGAFMPILYNQIMDLIMKDERFVSSDILSTMASPVGKKGKKTDVHIVITLKSGRVIQKNVSAKASGQDKVSIHQAKASDFISTLKITDSTVQDALNTFQKYGNASGMTTEEEKALKNYFAKPAEYQAFLDWIFMGPSGKVDYLLLHSYERDDQKVCCHTKIYHVKDYMALVKKSVKVEVGFGTGLTWTYKSVKSGGKKRNEIQLKVPLIF